MNRLATFSLWVLIGFAVLVLNAVIDGPTDDVIYADSALNLNDALTTARVASKEMK